MLGNHMSRVVSLVPYQYALSRILLGFLRTIPPTNMYFPYSIQRRMAVDFEGSTLVGRCIYDIE